MEARGAGLGRESRCGGGVLHQPDPRPQLIPSVYTMRMARVNITVPDELLDQARAAGLNVSRLAATALAEEIDRRAKIAQLDAYLAALEAELGPVPEQELDAAREWADAVLPADRPTPSRSGR